MSKMDDLRAMREAAHDQAMARKSKGTTASADTAPPAARRATRTSAPKAAKAPQDPAAPSPSSLEGLCGHRSMNGRSCTREQGHAAKSHRYS